ncbi:hypothetical protein ABPG77_009350 [Micractinium sp. CCAP 211/92]
MDHEREPLAGGEEPLSDSFDDVELGPGSSARTQLANAAVEPRAGQEIISHRQQRVVRPGTPAQAGAAGAGGGGGAGADANFHITTSRQFIDYVPLQQTLPQQQQQQQQQVNPASNPGSRPASFSLVAASGLGATGPAVLPMQPQPESPPVSTGAAGLLASGSGQWPAAALLDAGEGEPPRKSPLEMMTAPVQVPVCSVIFSLVCGILALVFFLLFLAHHDRWEATGCTLLLSAASAAAGPASLTLHLVHDPATLVCLGKEDHAPQVTEDALASLLAAHPQAFSEAEAQLSFTPAGSAQRWGISLEIKGLVLNATAGSATVQASGVKDWEAAAAADSGTVYPGTEAFARQFGKGVPLGAPLLVLRLEDEGLVVGLGD